MFIIYAKSFLFQMYREEVVRSGILHLSSHELTEPYKKCHCHYSGLRFILTDICSHKRWSSECFVCGSPDIKGWIDRTPFSSKFSLV